MLEQPSSHGQGGKLSSWFMDRSDRERTYGVRSSVMCGGADPLKVSKTNNKTLK